VIKPGEGGGADLIIHLTNLGKTQVNPKSEFFVIAGWSLEK
jgi:hypothetical protein